MVKNLAILMAKKEDCAVKKIALIEVTPIQQ